MQLALFRGDRARAESLVPLISRQPVHSHRGARPPYKRHEYYQLGSLALLEGENQKALEMFREALRHWPGWADFSIREDCLGDAFLQLGQWPEAIAEYQRVLESFPGRALARFHLGVAYEHSGHPQLARGEYARFLELWRSADSDGKEVQAARNYLAKTR
jgi:tetratricopeptide (TPR) repeat protein